MVQTFNFTALKMVFPSLAAHIPAEISDDPDYIYKVDTDSHVIELGYRDDPWVLE